MAVSIVLVQLTYSILYCSTYCLNLNGAAVDNLRALFMLRRYTCNNIKQRPCFIWVKFLIGFGFKQCLSIIQPILVPKLKRMRSTRPTLAVYIKAVLAITRTLMQAM